MPRENIIQDNLLDAEYPFIGFISREKERKAPFIANSEMSEIMRNGYLFSQ